jgi:two-component system sensor histidine kinase UhpB
MSLQRQLIDSVILVLMISLAIGACLSYEHAVSKVRVEMAAALDVGRHVVGNAVDDPDEQLDPMRQLMLLVADFNGDRHIRAVLRDRTGQIVAQSVILPPDDPMPQPIYALVASAPQPITMALPPRFAAIGQLTLNADPHNEVAEAWSDLKLTLQILGVFFTLVLGLIIWIIRRTLRPLRGLCDALTRVGSGKYRTRVSGFDYRELRPVQTGFNDMAERLERMKMQNAMLHLQMQSIQEDERAELSRDLHDEVAPFLFATSADAVLIGEYALVGATADISARAEAITTSVSHMQRHLRGVLSRLTSNALLDLGLPGAIDSLVSFWQARRPDLRFTTRISDDPVPDKIANVLFRVVQESTTNAVRHGAPTKIAVSVQARGSEVEVEVTDDGTGLAAGDNADGFGVLGMQQRVAALGGTFSMRTGPSGRGVIVHASLPWREPMLIVS